MNETTEPQAATEGSGSRHDALVMRAQALLDLLNSDFGMSGGIAIEAIRVELEAVYMDGLKEGFADCELAKQELDNYRKLIVQIG